MATVHYFDPSWDIERIVWEIARLKSGIVNDQNHIERLEELLAEKKTAQSEGGQ